MISQENETSELVITPELIGTLSIPALVELLLHRSNLFSATSRTQLSDENYTSNLQKEITAIHDEIKRRRYFFVEFVNPPSF